LQNTIRNGDQADIPDVDISILIARDQEPAILAQGQRRSLAFDRDLNELGPGEGIPDTDGSVITYADDPAIVIGQLDSLNGVALRHGEELFAAVCIPDPDKTILRGGHESL
jgi:hypothetical protein